MTTPDRRRLGWHALAAPLIAAMVTVSLPLTSGLVAYGILQGRVASLEGMVERLERNKESSERTDRDVLQRLSSLEGKIDSLRDLMRENRRAEAPR